MTLAELSRHARRRLRDAGLETPDLDARLLVEHATGTTATDLIARPDMEVAADALEILDAALARRAAGEPVHRIIGHREFYGMRLALSPDTLEPRPDTETLVDAVLPLLSRLTAQGIRPRILDLGTGTGAIALALLKHAPSATALAVDISAGAVDTARANAESEGLADRFETRLSDWFSEVTEKFHAIVSNPPYITTDRVRRLSREVREHDPARALDGGSDGLDAYRIIAAQSAARLAGGGQVAVEVGYDQSAEVTRLFGEAGFELSGSHKDLQGHHRALVFSMA